MNDLGGSLGSFAPICGMGVVKEREERARLSSGMAGKESGCTLNVKFVLCPIAFISDIHRDSRDPKAGDIPEM
jgi:hypothetical protein